VKETNMTAPKRPNYFQSQFLVVRDFQDEQFYHEELVRRHNLLMHEWGVVREGLKIKKANDNVNFVIEAGSAIDSYGREISLETPRTLNAAEVQAARQAAGAGQDVYVTIAFNEVDSSEPDDKYPPPSGTQVTRKVQSPDIAVTKSPASDGKVIILARIAADGAVNNSVRKLASSFISRGTNLNLGDVSLEGALSFTSNYNQTTQMGLDFSTTGDHLRIRARTGSVSSLDTTYLTIQRGSGNVGIGTTGAPGQKLEVAGALKLAGTPTVSHDHFAAYFWNQANVGPTIAGYGFEVRTTGDAPKLRINNAGNVGIGTPTPETKLHVVGNNTALPATSGTKQSAGHVTRLKGSTNAVLDIGAGEKSFWLQSTDENNLATNNSLLLNVNGGNVGIGTNAPKSSLHIRKDNLGGLGPTLTLMNGAGKEHAKVEIDLHTYWVENRQLPTGRIICEDNGQGTGHLIFQTKEANSENMLERLRLDASGNVGISGSVGIGTSGQPKAKFEVGDTSRNTMKSILARLDEGNTFLGVKAHSTQPASAKSFAFEHYFRDKLNNAINFFRGGSETGGFITFDIKDGTEKMILNEHGMELKGDLDVKGRISCGGMIAIKSAEWGRWISARDSDDKWVVRTQDINQGYEHFTIEMACSREIKENVADLTALEAMTTLQNLTPVKYDYKGEKAFRQNLGFIAEDMPDNLASEDRKSISPFEVVPILTRVAKEQQRVIAELQETIRAIQKDVRQE